jgi:hypothetical protein
MSDSTPTPATAFECPRCSEAAVEVFYGPCTACREQLRATMWIEAPEGPRTAYEPKMNVVPNHVATKD